MDLKEGWEEKALIGVGIIVLIIIVYAYFVPFSGTPDNITQTNQQTPAQVVPVPYVIPAANNSTSNNSTNNGNSTLTVQQAQNIAHNAYPNYSIGTPSFQNNININGTTYSAWTVPITLNGTSKTVYIDNTGRIIQTS